MKTTKRTVYLKKDFATVITPSWQRWRNEKNVKDLAEAVSENGQLRDVLVCKTSDGTKYLTDGAHLVDAMTKILNARKVNVLEKLVQDEEEARRTFISFNTRGKTLKNIDYIVSYAGSGNKDYKRFLKDVMQSPKSLKEARNVHGKLFTIPSLISIFFKSNITAGKARLINNFERVVDLVEYLGRNYLLNARIIAHQKKNGTKMVINGGSIIPVVSLLNRYTDLNNTSNNDVLDRLIDYTTYHFNSMEAPTYTKDACEGTFELFLKL